MQQSQVLQYIVSNNTVTYSLFFYGNEKLVILTPIESILAYCLSAINQKTELQWVINKGQKIKDCQFPPWKTIMKQNVAKGSSPRTVS